MTYWTSWLCKFTISWFFPASLFFPGSLLLVLSPGTIFLESVLLLPSTYSIGPFSFTFLLARLIDLVGWGLLEIEEISWIFLFLFSLIF